MTPDYCELDPDGDVILILERRHEEDGGEEGVPIDDSLSPTEEAPAEEAPAEEAPAEWPAAEEPPAELLAAEDPLAEEAPAEWPAAEEIPVEDHSTEETLTGDVQDFEKRPKSEHIRMRVSSKHLILASSYFE